MSLHCRKCGLLLPLDRIGSDQICPKCEEKPEKEIKRATEYFKKIDSAINFVNKPEYRQKSVMRIAIAALKTMEWLDRHNFVGNDGDVVAMIEQKFEEFKQG